MIRFNAALFYLHSTWLDRFDVLIRDAPSPKTYLEESRDEFLDSLGIFKDSLRETGLTISLISLDRLSEAIAIGEPSRVRDCAHELNGRVRDELLSLHLWQVPSEKAELYGNPKLFGDDVALLFPQISFDVEEAGSCLALDRPTASVFHLMRIMEEGLRFFAQRSKAFGISIPDPNSNRSWHSWLDPIEKELRKERKTKSPGWNEVEPIYAQVAGHLRTVSTAWRNPTMHVETKYTSEEASDILSATRAFMRNLARNFQDQGQGGGETTQSP